MVKYSKKKKMNNPKNTSKINWIALTKLIQLQIYLVILRQIIMMAI